MTTIEEILRNRVKIVGDGEWTLLGTPDDVIKELEEYALQARIDELKHLREFWGETIDHTLGEPIKLKFVGLEDIDRRIVELKAPHKNERNEK